MKTCTKCNLEKEESEYYGKQGECKTCTKKRVDEREKRLRQDPMWVEREKERAREKYHRLYSGGVHKPSYEKKKEIMRRYNEKYPEKRRAKNLSDKLLKNHLSNEFHHWSYAIENAKDVFELSPKEHAKAHRFLVYDQERMMYRRTDNNELLDTKEAHREWIEWCIQNKED